VKLLVAIFAVISGALLLAASMRYLADWRDAEPVERDNGPLEPNNVVLLPSQRSTSDPHAMTAAESIELQRSMADHPARGGR